MNATNDVVAKGARKPLLALAAGLVMPGLGHIYTGDFVRGISCLLGGALVVPAVSRLALHVPVGGLCFTLFAGVVATIALYAWSAIEAYRRARRCDGEAPRPWQRPAVYVLYAVVAIVFVLAPLARNVREGVVETFIVPSASMMPNVLPGDRIVADKTVGHVGGAHLWRGALAVFVNPNDRTQTFIKRVVALPGDRVEIDGGDVRINGVSLAVAASEDDAPGVVRERGDHGTYAVLRGAGPAGTPPSTKLVVPDGQVFVLGDNRAAALDSRRFGTVPLVDVKGVARQIWFSAGHGAGVRWGRVGRVLE